MNLGLFQLLPGTPGGDDRELVTRALREVDLAEEHGFHSLWVTEHHGSRLGSIGVPSVYAAAVAQRTRRLRLGFAVAVLPLHHPLRLAEEVAWVDHLSGGRLLLGVGAGFSQDEFAALGVPLDERHERLEEGLAILRGVFTHEVFAHEGRFWRFPPFTLRPRPYTRPHPPLCRASSSPGSIRRAAAEGMPLLLGTKSAAEIGDCLRLYRQVRAELGVPTGEVEQEIGAAWVLRQVVVAATDAAARAAAPDGMPPGSCVGAPETVVRALGALADLGVRNAICWLPQLAPAARRGSLRLLAHEVLPAVAGAPAAAVVAD